MFCLLVSVGVIPPLTDREGLRLHIDYKGTVAWFSYQGLGCPSTSCVRTASFSCFHRTIKSSKHHWEGSIEGLLVKIPAQIRTVATAGSGQLFLSLAGLWKTNLQIWQPPCAMCSCAARPAQLCCYCFGSDFFFNYLPRVPDIQGSLKINSKERNLYKKPDSSSSNVSYLSSMLKLGCQHWIEFVAFCWFHPAY